MPPGTNGTRALIGPSEDDSTEDEGIKGDWVESDSIGDSSEGDSARGDDNNEDMAALITLAPRTIWTVTMNGMHCQATTPQEVEIGTIVATPASKNTTL